MAKLRPLLDSKLVAWPAPAHPHLPQGGDLVLALVIREAVELWAKLETRNSQLGNRSGKL